MKSIKLKAFVAFIVTAKLVQAQTDSLQLNDVTIVGNRLQSSLRSTNLSSTVLTKSTLKSLSGSVPADWLGTVSGVDIRQRGPFGVQTDMGIRGGSFDQSLVLLNGLKLNDPQTGHHMFNLPLTTDAIEQIDVVKIAASRMYGIGALTGAVNFITKVPTQNQVYLNGFGGDFGLYGLQAGVALNKKTSGTHVAYSRSQSDGYSRNTDFKMDNLFLQQTVKGKKYTLNAIGGYTDRSFGATGFYVKNSNEYETIQTAFGGLIYEVKLGKLNIKTQGYYRYNQDHYIYIRSNPSVFQNRHFSQVGGAEVHATYKNFLGETGVGVDVRREYLKSNNLGDRRRDILGAFLEHRFKLINNRLTITPGVYVNQITDNKLAFFPGIDGGFAATKNIHLFASISKGMRLPTYTDLYYKGPNNIGNPNLKAEEATSSEVGAKYFGKGFNASVAGFHRNSTNLIDWARTDDTQKWQPLNVNHVVFKGIESNLSLQFKGMLSQVQIGYTYIDANIKQSEGYQSTYALTNLRHQVTGTVQIKWYKNITQSITVRHINRVTLTDYTLVDSKLAYAFKYGRVYTDVSNIFNADYTEAGFVTMPGRWFKLGVDLKLNFK